MAHLAELDALLAQGEEHGCIAASDVASFVEQLNLDEDEVQQVHAAIEARGFDISDDCGRELPDAPAATVTYTNMDLAVFTTDALQQFLNEADRHRLLAP